MSLMSDISIDDLLTSINWNPERSYRPVLGPDEFPSKDRLAMISPPGGGKTTTVAGMFMHATNKVGDTLHSDTKFKCRMLENASSIHQDISDLSDGIFPAKTQYFLGFKSSPGMLLEQFRQVGVTIPFTKKFFGRHDDLRPTTGMWHKARQISINDLPGETLSKVQWQYRLKTGEDQKALADIIGNAIMEMRSCQSFIFILNCAKAHGLGLPIEAETDPNVSKDPDVSLVRSFTDIANSKAKHGERIKELHVVLSSWDKLESRAGKLGFDMFDKNLVRKQEILENFTRRCFFQFFGAIHSHGIPEEHIHYYPTFFQTEKDKDGNEIKYDDNIEYVTPDNKIGVTHVRRPHIMQKPLDDPDAHSIWDNIRGISASWESFDALLNNIMQTAPVVK